MSGSICRMELSQQQEALLAAQTPRATIDFESRSQCSLEDCGSWRYSEDSTTEVLCFAFHLPGWEESRTGLWYPANKELGLVEPDDTDLMELFYWIAQGEMVEAHNAWFERGIWTNICKTWPLIEDRQWMCSAAKAAAHSLPRSLDDAVDALRLPIRKDEVGSKLMKSMVKPAKWKKAERALWAIQFAGCFSCYGKGKVKIPKVQKLQVCEACGGSGLRPLDVPDMPVKYIGTRADHFRLHEYCRTDVRAEKGLSESLPDLSPAESRIFALDQRINERGFGLDKEAIDAALDIIDELFADSNRELARLTQGAVTKATQRAKFIAWCGSMGFALDNTQGETLDAIIESPPEGIPPDVLTAIELTRTLGRSSTAKYVTMRDWLCRDSRAHGGLLYHGAGTGRWSGKGIQPHNFPKGVVKGLDMVRAWEALKTRDIKRVESINWGSDERPSYGDIMQVLSSALRGVIVPTQGSELFVADYAAIEARVLLWLAEDDDALDVFRQGKDIYCEMASAIYNRPINKKDDPDERQLGKAAVLGLGYQMGASKFVDSAATYGATITEEFAKDVVDAYRSKFWRVKEMWWAMEKAAIRATDNPGRTVRCGRVSWVVEGDFLYVVLPSGRRLAYPDPEVRENQTPWGETRDQLTFMGVDAYTRKWKRQSTYGGSIVENIVQAIARDLMAEAMLRAEDTNLYKVVLTVHDELVAEAPVGKGDVKEFEHLTAALPDWAWGMPVEAEGWKGPRYRK